MSADTIPTSPNIYPLLKITKIANPNRFYAVPLVGIFVKFIMLIPVYIFLFVLGVATLCTLIVNSFAIFFTGKYMKIAYDLVIGVMHLNAKVDFFYSGLTNTYPGFSLDIKNNFSVDFPYPQNPNRWFAIPLLGGLARLLLLIPFYIFSSIVKNGVTVALAISWIPVLFQGYYPDTTFELDRDYVRLNLAQWAYFTGLSDKYPSFWISLNHKQKKLLLLLAGLLLFFSNSGKHTQPTHVRQSQRNMYQQNITPTQPRITPNG